MAIDLFASLGASASGLKAQSTRLRIISENVANAGSTGSTPGADPYRRKTITFKAALDATTGVNEVAVDRIGEDGAAFELAYDPSHPAADERGYVKKPNVKPLLEMVDMREASRSYEANLKTLETSRDMLQRALELLR